jgi:virginiamycin A acetyltransferase
MHPNPDKIFPFEEAKFMAFLRPLLEQSVPRVRNIRVGEFSYYSDFEDATQFFERNVKYNFGFSGSQLEIGSYCAIAHGTTFIMADANHVLSGVSTYPFPIFGGDWSEEMSLAEMPFPNKGDIVVGNDVWFGIDSLVLPGVRIGHGAIIGARTVVSADVPDYAVVVGNPGIVVKMRFTPEVVEELLSLAWWEWPRELLNEAIPMLVKGDIEGLKRCGKIPATAGSRNSNSD